MLTGLFPCTQWWTHICTSQSRTSWSRLSSIVAVTECMDPDRKLRFVPSAHSDVASGLSDGNENVPTSSGRHEGRTTKRHMRRSVRSRSRHEKTSRPKLRILNVSIACLRDSSVVLVWFWASTSIPSIIYLELFGALDMEPKNGSTDCYRIFSVSSDRNPALHGTIY